MTLPASPSVQGVRPTPRELAHEIQDLWLNMKEPTHYALLSMITAAIARDREQGRAADAAEIARLREVLERIGGPDEDDCCPICGMDVPSCDLDAERFPDSSACEGADARRALATPADPAVKETKRP